MHAEIVGAGFAGLVAGATLARLGWSVRVHERATELRAFGAGIFIWENGLRVLRAIGAYEQAMAGAHEAPSYYDREPEGTISGRDVFGPALGTRMVTMTRQRLYAAVLDAALRHGVEVRRGSNVVSASVDGTIETEGGEIFVADLIVGADGVNSKVRAGAGLLCSRIESGYGAIRLLVPRHAGDVDDVVSHKEAGPRRVLYVPCDAETLYLCFTTRADDAQGRHLPFAMADWTRSFPALGDVFSRIGDQGRWDLFETIRTHAWSTGKVALIGDAAHGMTPALGQGAGCAMMNALSLGVAVSQGLPLAQALAAWEAEERPLTEHTQTCSHEFFTGFPAGSKSGTRWDDTLLRTARHVPTGAVA